MNVALPALIVFLLVLPGFIFRDRFKRTERTVLDYAPFGRVVAEAVLWAAALHAAWLACAWLFRAQFFRLDILLGLLSANPVAQSHAIETLVRQADWVAEYFSSLLIASLLVPIGMRWLITRFRLDRFGHWLAPVVRFNDAPWYYLLTGADFAAEKLPDLIKISAIVDVAGEPYLYQGFLDDFYFNPGGELDRLVLEEASRRPLDRDKTAAGNSEQAATVDDRFYPIDGDYFVLRYSEAITLNVVYIKLNDQGSRHGFAGDPAGVEETDDAGSEPGEPPVGLGSELLEAIRVGSPGRAAM